MINTKMATIGTIMRYTDQDTGTVSNYIVISKVGKWVDEQFTLRGIDPDSGYPYGSSDLTDPGWEMVSA